jgi:hypothetical protein
MLISNLIKLIQHRTPPLEESKALRADHLLHSPMMMETLPESFIRSATGHTHCSMLPATLFPSRSLLLCVLPNVLFAIVSLIQACCCICIQAFTFLREFILGSNTTGLVTNASVPAIGGEDPKYNVSNIPAGPEIYLGSASTQSTYIAPSATIAAWDSFYATVVPTPTEASAIKASSGGGSNGDDRKSVNWSMLAIVFGTMLVAL